MTDAVSIPKTYVGHVARIISAANQLQQTILTKSRDLRGAQKKYIATHALTLAERQLVALHNITLWTLNEETEQETPEAPPPPVSIKAPKRLKGAKVNPKSVRAMNTIIRQVNRLQTVIHDCLVFYIQRTPFVPRPSKAAASRAIVEIIRALREGKEQLSPTNKPAEIEQAKEVFSAIQRYLIINEARLDDRAYKALIQRAEQYDS